MGILSALFRKKEPHPVVRWSKTLGQRRTLEKTLDDTVSKLVHGPNDMDAAFVEMTRYVLSDLSLSTIGKSHNLTKEEVGDLFSNLRRHGAGQWINGVYLPVMAICWPGTLDYVIRKFRDGTDDDAISGSMRLIDYFSKQEKGILRPDGSILSVPLPTSDR